MSEPPTSKPRPGRFPESEAPAGPVKPTPAREMPGAARGAQGPPTEPDVTEVELETGSVRWRVEVLGRAGAGGRAPPLLLLGFFAADTHGGAPLREAMVVGRALSELPRSCLEEALAASSPPPDPDRKKPFFEGADQGRRGAPRPDS